MNNTKIEWCTHSLNPVVGCTHGCSYCYAREMNNRFQYVKDFEKPEFFKERLEQLKVKKPRNIFMDSMSDIADWEDEWIAETLMAIDQNPQHNYLFLSKRPKVYSKFCRNSLGYRANVWLGATITNTDDMNNKGYKLFCSTGFDCNGAAHRFLSMEPLLSGIDKWSLENVQYMQWIIIGAQTGNKGSKIVPKLEWINDIVSECDKNRIPVFMKESLIPIVGESNMRREFPRGLMK